MEQLIIDFGLLCLAGAVLYGMVWSCHNAPYNEDHDLDDRD